MGKHVTYDQDAGSSPVAVIYGDVVQSVERRTVNPCVGGSIPPISASLRGLDSCNQGI